MKADPAMQCLKDTIRSHPNASEKEIATRVYNAATQSKPIDDAIFAYWFQNNFRRFSVVISEPHRTAIFEKHRKMRAESTRTVRSVVDKLRVALMDHLLTNGKLVRFATFGDLAKESGWLGEVAKLGKPNEIVGKKLTEIDLVNIRMRNRKRAA